MTEDTRAPEPPQHGLPPFDERERLAELRSLDILDTPADKYFDRYTHLVAEIFKVPMVAVSLVDEDRQWIKSSVGVEVGERPLEDSFCVHALEKNLLEVPDTLEDDFFRHHPLVVGSPFIRFYMGTVLRGPTGQPLGTLHIMDTESRYLSELQRTWLVTFGHIVEELIIHNHALNDARDGARRASLRNTLTNLPDQVLFVRTLKHLIRMSEEKGRYLAILYVRVNKLDEVSRVHGRPTRDAMLYHLAERLIATDVKTLTVGHLSQACFGAVIDLPSLDDVFDVVTPITNKLTSPIEVENTTIRPDIDVGISLSPVDGLTPEDLLGNASAALEGPSSHAGLYVFSHKVEERALRRDTIEQHLESALRDQQLTKYYQALVAVDGSRIVGFEALARWQDAELGNVSPRDFVPIAEKNARLSKMLTEWSLKTVAGESPQWPFRAGDPPLRIAINISPAQFLGDGFVGRVLYILEEHRLAPERLILELTEESILTNVDKAIRTMREFRNHGVHISLDDFGTGYSSLSHIKDLPLDTLKIDKSFIDDLTHDSRSAQLVDGIIHIAHGLGLQVVAEGVEHEAQRALLQESGCDVIQGYLFSRPLPAEDALALLKNWTPAS
ncbi:bifunctional diguanylate cyclase/phosphodiesterase [Thioalkalivibrio sp. ALMg13-2]|uniref:putative bifunctional diguanylate cyclase/phosphodiesterase n=1 Tax=Thioalkalivibrio sp. ALMg13-2 TaxID=1158167 RepID=UPI00037667CF|nr:GGDEF and EAL domain-containing protein [Thioalkalivibrio sp. ALMg13-2]